MGNEDAGGGKAIGNAKDGAKVEGVLEVVGDNQARIDLGEQFGGGGVGEGGHFGDGALVVGGATALGEARGRFPFDGNARRFGESREFLLIGFVREMQDVGPPAIGAEGLAEKIAAPDPGALVGAEEWLGHF